VSHKSASFTVHPAVPYLSYYAPIGAKIFVQYRFFQPNGRTLVASGAARNVPLGANQTVSSTVKLPGKYRMLKGLTYILDLTMVDKYGNTTKQVFDIVVS
jgi:hypothetical protein